MADSTQLWLNLFMVLARVWSVYAVYQQLVPGSCGVIS